MRLPGAMRHSRSHVRFCLFAAYAVRTTLPRRGGRRIAPGSRIAAILFLALGLPSRIAAAPPSVFYITYTFDRAYVGGWFRQRLWSRVCRAEYRWGRSRTSCSCCRICASDFPFRCFGGWPIHRIIFASSLSIRSPMSNISVVLSGVVAVLSAFRALKASGVGQNASSSFIPKVSYCMLPLPSI